MDYDSSLTLRDARSRYFAANGFGEGGYSDSWVKLMAGPIPIYFPNTKARVRAVKLHDLHHVLTEYDTTWTGEGEIAAWELATGCAHHYASWLLNLNGLAIGLFLNPRRLFAAFLRAKCSHCLYQGEFEEAMLQRRVGEMRHELGLDGERATTSARLVGEFGGWAVLSLLTLLVTVAISLAPTVAVISFVLR